jgi:hypothetical protein
MAFGLILAGAALAAALAFGLGGQDMAKFQLVRWYRSAEAALAAAPEAAAGPPIPPAPEADLPETPFEGDEPVV